MEVKYRLGEVAKWSIGHPAGEHRYVDVTSPCVNAEGSLPRSQTLELPTDDAIKLVASHGGLSSARFKAFLEGKKTNGWMASDGGISLALLTSSLSRLAMTGTGYMANGGSMELKYIEVRIDMRSGDWVAKNAFGQEATDVIVHMLAQDLDHEAYVNLTKDPS